MTGQPEFTFRGTDAAPECQECGTEMAFKEHREGPHNEQDVYECDTCGDQYVDRWTF